MIDIDNAVKVFKEYIEPYNSMEDVAGFKLKEEHTYNVMKKSRELAELIGLDEENVKLAELIGLLHDIGRFDEMKIMNSFDGNRFDHAKHGVEVLRENGLMRKFIADSKFDYVIERAIYNHNKLTIEDGLDDAALLHARIIRDSDKLDNFRVKQVYKPEHLFKNTVNSQAEFENSQISDKIYSSVLNEECAKNSDRKYALDYYILVLGFVFDLYFKESYIMVEADDSINKLVDRFDYKLPESKEKMEKIRAVINDFIHRRARGE